MELLARREHSQQELRQKLAIRYGHDDPDVVMDIDDCIAGLEADLLQSDQRYTEAYVAMRKRKGYGPMRLQTELRDKGIDPEMIAAELNNPEHDWYEQARLVLHKKFSEIALDHKERARQMRFLQYRGFYHDQIQEAVTATRL